MAYDTTPVVLDDGQDLYSCHWEWTSSHHETFHAINISLHRSWNENGVSGHIHSHQRGKPFRGVFEFLADTARLLLKTTGRPQAVLVKLLLPSRSGFISRSDFLSTRMVGCDFIHSIKEFVEPGQYLDASHLDNASLHSLTAALGNVVAAIVLHDREDEPFGKTMQRLDSVLSERLSFPWTVTTPLERNRLVIVGHRHPEVMGGYLKSAFALGIRVTFVDAEGAFIPPDRRSGAVERCIPIDMTPDERLSTRIAEALSATGITYHGITTFTDTLLVHVAKVAQVLELPSAPVEIVKICLDKHATRLLCPDATQAVRIKGPEDLKALLDTGNNPFQYPVIVKPCTGWGSQGVHKARTEAELFDAVSQAKTSAKDADLLIDTYVDGPEVDANFVLQDGKILFFELVDGLPCTAEMGHEGQSKPGDFLETDEVWPSNHPQKEVHAVKSSLHSILLQTGLRDGVYHLEARIRNSAVHYALEDGIIDLRPKDAEPAAEPSAFLLEINQRPPGNGGSRGTALAYGIDYPALHMLCAVGERERFRALSRPFEGGVRQWVDSIFINSDAGGVYEGGDIGQELRESRPDLMAHVHYSTTYYEKGQTLTSSPARVALFVIASSEGRRKVLEISQQIRQAVEVKII